MSQDAIREKVIEIVAARFDTDKAKITDTSSYVEDLGADSLDIAEMSMEFEDAFAITIPDEEQPPKTVGETVAYIKKLKSAK